MVFNEIEKLQETLFTKHQNDKVVLAGGVFDLFHVGHLYYLEEAKKYGDILVVHIKPDKWVKKRKGNTRPIYCAADRARILDGLKCVDYILISELSISKGEVLEIIKPAVLVKTRRSEYIDSAMEEKIKYYKEISPDTHVVFIPEIFDLHTSAIIKGLLGS